MVYRNHTGLDTCLSLSRDVFCDSGRTPPNFSEPQFPHLLEGGCDLRTFLIELLKGTGAEICVKP